MPTNLGYSGLPPGTLVSTVQLSQADIAALASTPILLVPNPGPYNLNRLIRCEIQSRMSSPWTVGAGAVLEVYHADGGTNPVLASLPNADLTTLLSSGAIPFAEVLAKNACLSTANNDKPMQLRATAGTITGPAGPSHYWPLDESSGSVVDQVGAGPIHGLADPGVLRAVGGALPGKTGSGVEFPGTAAINFPSFTMTPPFTIEVWVNAAPPRQPTQPLWTNRTSGIPGNLLLQLAGGQPQFVSSAGNVAPSGVLIDDGGWHHLAITNTGIAQQMFLDGTLVTTGGNAMGATTGIAQMGHDDFGGYAAHMRLDEMVISPRVLSAAEIAAHAGGQTAQDILMVRTYYIVEPLIRVTF